MKRGGGLWMRGVYSPPPNLQLGKCLATSTVKGLPTMPKASWPSGTLATPK